MSTSIPTRERDAAIQALRSGVVPRLGIRHVQVGRAQEVEEVIKDVTRIADGGCAVRVILGEYGSGKTFFLSLAATIATEKKLVVMKADLTPDRRIHATGGRARLLCSDLIRSMATRTKPEGGALQSVVERFIGLARDKATESGSTLSEVIHAMLEPVRDQVGGYDFAAVLVRYWQASQDDNDAIKQAALRWLRAEFSLKTEAKEALGVRTIVDDAMVYDHLKAIACLVRLAGYDGTFVVLDEMVNLFKITNPQSRNANYEQILRIVNDALQGSAQRLGFYFGGTPECVLDMRRGLFSYEALRSRLAENTFVKDGLVDLSGPIIRLNALTPEELYVLLTRLRLLWAAGDTAKLLVPEDALIAFLAHCSSKLGSTYFRTPRNVIKAFLDLMAVLEQNIAAKWQDLIKKVDIELENPMIADGGTAEDHQAAAAPGGGIAGNTPFRQPPAAPVEQASQDDTGLATFRL